MAGLFSSQVEASSPELLLKTSCNTCAVEAWFVSSRNLCKGAAIFEEGKPSCKLIDVMNRANMWVLEI